MKKLLSLIPVLLFYLGVLGQSGPKNHLVADNDVSIEQQLPQPFATPETPVLEVLEVTQVIQDWKNSIPLFNGKETLVRAYITAKEEKSFTARLIVRDMAGNEVFLNPLNAKYKTQKTTTSNNAKLDWRKNLDKSLNFILTPELSAGQKKLTLEGGGKTIDCKKVANDCSVTVNFQKPNALEVEFVNVKWKNKDDQHTPYIMRTEEFEKAVTEVHKRIVAMYPIDKIKFSINATKVIQSKVRLPDSYADFLTQVNEEIGTLRPQNANRLYVGLLKGPHSGGPQVVGAAAQEKNTNINLPYGSVLLYPDVESSPAGDFSTAAHEVAHMLGIYHVDCGSPAKPFENFPPENRNRIGPTPNGPTDQNINKYIFGYNSHSTKKNSKPKILSYESYDLMTYCRDDWMSDYTYNNKLIPFLENRFSQNPQSPVANLNGLLNKQVLNAVSLKFYSLFRGTIDFINDTAVFDPVYPGESDTELPVPSTGEYRLQLLDEVGNVQKAIDFTPIVSTEAIAPQTGYFIIPVPFDESIKKAVVVKDNVPIGQRVATKNAPTVKVSFPNGGEQLSDTAATVTWEANDADGDALTYLVEFSNDGGSTWKTLGLDVPDKSYEIDLTLLGKTPNALIRVTASDGFNTAMDESDGTFSTPNSSPAAFIDSPSDSDVFAGETPVIFSGTALDVEDGKLNGTSLSWTSNLNGFLGNGENLYLPDATQLKAGVHIITFIATDKDGVSARDSVKIIVQGGTTPPSSVSIACPADITAGSDAGKCTAAVSFIAKADGTPTPAVAYKIGGTTIISPYNFPVGTTTVTATASNGMAPDATCSFNVTVSDKEKPVLTCPVIPPLCYNPTGIYSIAAVKATDNCGVQSYAYTVSGATVRSGTGADAGGLFNPGKSTVEWTVSDVNGNTATCQSAVTVTMPASVTIPDAKALSQGVDPNTVYTGYSPASSLKLTAQVIGGDGNLRYKWSTGAIASFITVSPIVSTVYSVTVTDGLGCTATATKQVNAADVRCGNKLDKVQVCHVPPGNPANAKEQCIAASAVPAQLSSGSYLGACKANYLTQSSNVKVDKLTEEGNGLLTLKAVPNPSHQGFVLTVAGADEVDKIVLHVFDAAGKLIETRTVQANVRTQVGALYRPGIYLAEVMQGRKKVSLRLVKQ